MSISKKRKIAWAVFFAALAAAAVNLASSFIGEQLQTGETLSLYAEKFEDDGTPTGEKIEVTINKDTVDFINSAIGVQE